MKIIVENGVLLDVEMDRKKDVDVKKFGVWKRFISQVLLKKFK